MAKKIYLIDDEKDFTELTRSLFEYQGFDAKSTNDPVEGLKILESESFDALIVDIMMPELDGITLVTRLRKNPQYTKTPIFVLSAKSLDDNDRKALMAQKVQFVSKPFEPRQLVEKVRASLGTGSEGDSFGSKS